MRVIVIGLDGFTWKTLESGMFEMENLSSMRKEGAWGRLRSTRPPNTVPAWITIATGCNPGKHGVFDFLRPEEDLSRTVPVSSSDIKVETVQQILSRKGKKSILMNLPCSTPALTDDVTLGSFMSVRDDFISPRKMGEIPEVAEYAKMPPHLMNEDLEGQLGKLLTRARQRTKTAKRLFSEEWDFFFNMYSESDMLQHLLFDKIKSGALGGNVKDKAAAIYQELDNGLGWALDNADDETYVIALSDHGFESYQYKFSLKNFLAEKRYLSFTEAKEAKKDRPGQRRVVNVSPLINSLYGNRTSRKLLDILRKTYVEIANVVPLGKFLNVWGYRMAVDTSKSSAMPITIDGYGIYLNRKDKFRNGTVEEYGRIRDELIEVLRNEKSPLTGKPTFRRVERADETYHGQQVTNGPDILIDLADHAIVGEGHYSGTYYRGIKNYHDPYGIITVSGAGIKKGELEGCHLMDIVPTVLHMMKLPVPSHIDGKVLDAFTEKQDVTVEDSRALGELRGKLGKLRKKLN
jgi:predicted AlkP superfamily phosphohydrolase/phosphomutase